MRNISLCQNESACTTSLIKSLIPGIAAIRLCFRGVGAAKNFNNAADYIQRLLHRIHQYSYTHFFYSNGRNCVFVCLEAEAAVTSTPAVDIKMVILIGAGSSCAKGYRGKRELRNEPEFSSASVIESAASSAFS